MARAEAAACGIPDFGPVVDRTRLVRVARMQNPALTVICAPPGYGKSVLAAQCAAALEHDDVLWVSLYDTDVQGDEWLGRVVEALSPSSSGVSEDECLPQYVCEASRADLTLKARDYLAAKAGKSVHLVLDGATRVDSLEPLVELATMLRHHATPPSRLTVTCRSIAVSEYVPDPAAVWIVGAEELPFDHGEVVQLLVDAGFAGDPNRRAEELLDRFAGHPALTSLMLRHEDADMRSNPPLDLVWHVQRLVAVLPDDSLKMPYCAALLRDGTAAELDDCMAAAGEASADWAVAQVLAPLLSVERDTKGLPVRFRMHGVMCGVLTSAVPARCGERAAAALRAGILTRLAHTRDSARLQSVLLTSCTVDEVAAYCEAHWSQLLRTVGPKAVERCLSRVPAVAISSSAPLLVLRAAVLRESERSEEAALHASLAQRIAEADGDRRTQAGAILLGVSSAIEVGDLITGREILGQIDSTMRDYLDLPARCLFESYRAVLDAYRADYESAHAHLRGATEMLRQIDARSWEAVWATNCVSGCLGQLQGRWDIARTLMMRAAAWPNTTPLQRLQMRANTAVSSLEMGCVQDARAMLTSVLREIGDVGLHGLTAYVTGTLADVLCLDQTESAEELYFSAQTMFAARQDEVGMAMEQTLHAMLRRADGSSEESLALAEVAVAQLRAKGSCVSLICAAAEIEVAASLLSLGDRWGARRIVSRMLSDLEDSGAAMHLLLATLVMAEIERQEGDQDSAVAILRPHGEYIATGSANWRTAMYCRAFPGLLCLLTAAFGAEELPLRMLRLIPSETIEAAAACGSGAFSEDVRAVITTRAMPGGEAGESAPAALEDECPQCHVRLFGGLEVTVAGAPVPDESWRKRKVRLLFAMLASRCGQDIPRDVLLERLWPDMDDERARRNFYVTWSAIKRGLANGGPPASSSSMLRSSGGVCRITKAVRVDLEDFDDAIAALRLADAAHDEPAVLSAARSLTSIYRGELLPGDIYEEWFSDIRERTKHDFCDAMMLAARAAEAAGDPDEALVFLRPAGEADPWREDIYQSMMRCQMVSGRRSSAIETYITCRGRLVEDLGIDPSAETTRLYEAVLAMESDATT